jgi:hypothetical protein
MKVLYQCRIIDLELDQGDRWGTERTKYQSAHNLFKTDMCVGITIKNPT